MGVKTYDFRSFCRGDLVENQKQEPQHVFVFSSGALITYLESNPEAVPVAGGNIQSAFDPIISMLQSMAYPVAFTCIAWACLEAMIGKPASAVSRAKWAIIGYLAMRYVPALLKSI